LSAYLSQHPDVFIPDAKELHYFGTDLEILPPGRNFSAVQRDENELAKYLSFFNGVNGETAIGEASVWYLYSEKAAEEIKAFDPDAKIIIMLRNPVDLIYSMHSQALWEGNEDIETFSIALDAEDDRKQGKQLPSTMHFRQGLFYRESIKFYSQVNRYIDLFHTDQLLILIYEDFFKNPELYYSKVQEFLGIQVSAPPKFNRVNANKSVRSRLLLDTLTKPPEWLRFCGKLLSPDIKSLFLSRLRKVNTIYTERTPLDPELRSNLLHEFKPDIEKLQTLLNQDVLSWLK
jgi:hypothetical protein